MAIDAHSSALISQSRASLDHALRGTFLYVRGADACRHSVWRDRCEATRHAARSGLICRVGGSSGAHERTREGEHERGVEQQVANGLAMKLPLAELWRVDLGALYCA